MRFRCLRLQMLDLSQPPNLMGLSMGGMITVAAAALYGSSFSHFVMLSGSAGSTRSNRMDPDIREMLLTNEGPAEDFLNMLFPIDTTEGTAPALHGRGSGKVRGAGLVLLPLPLPGLVSPGTAEQRVGSTPAGPRLTAHPLPRPIFLMSRV